MINQSTSQLRIHTNGIRIDALLVDPFKVTLYCIQ